MSPKNPLSEHELDELSNYNPALTYGSCSDVPVSNVVPAFVGRDQVLIFFAYFKQTVHESPDEFYCIRPVKILYYLEDDSIAVIEPTVENSGIPQGKFIKRQCLPKSDLGECWHWKDFNIGLDVTFYGKNFLIYDCADWTKEFMTAEGIILNEPIKCPVDPYMDARNRPSPSTHTTNNYDKLKQFLELDRKVLKFQCIWDDRDSMFGEVIPCVLHYYLVDDTMEIREVHSRNDGRDLFPVLSGRQRMPIDRCNLSPSFPTVAMEITEHEIHQWFEPKHFKLGETVFIMGRRFFLNDCDNFTADYYKKKFNVDFKSIDVSEKAPTTVKHKIPPYNGFGSLEDSLQSCLSLVPQPPKKDFIKMLENDKKVLRYDSILDSKRPEDKLRKFVISYRLADDMISIHENAQRNSGIIGGKFLTQTRVRKPHCQIDSPDFFTPADFSIGAVIEVFNHRFVITGADEYVLKYLELCPGKFPANVIESFRKAHGKAQDSSQ